MVRLVGWGLVTLSSPCVIRPELVTLTTLCTIVSPMGFGQVPEAVGCW